MVRFLKTSLLLLVVIVGVWLLLNKDRIRGPEDVIQLARQKLASWESTPSYVAAPPLPVISRSTPSTLQSDPRSSSTPAIKTAYRTARQGIRVASMMIDSTDGSPYESASLMLADICRRYDVIALQGIRLLGANSAVSLVEQMNSIEATQSAGPRPSYRLLIDQARSEAGARSTQLAIVYDEAAVALDNDRWYQVRDPDDILVHKPMVAWFRARGVPAEQAFTFSLANVQLDSQRPGRELRYLSELFRAIRDDGRGEDDVMIAGNFNAGDRGLAPIQQKSGLTWVISGTPTNTNRTAQFDNIVFNPAATVEFTQRGGVFDFMKHYNLRLANAHQISTHLPVWAEFSLREGQQTNSGRTARK